MRDCCNNVLTVNTEDVIYKEVVVIGNGPSGIILSYILSGNWPYYNGGKHPDEMLTARLQYMPQDKSLLEQDLDMLSQGLEGRSRNPVSVLVDNLNHPFDDQDLTNNDRCLIEWKHNSSCIDHVIIGKGKPGGSWQALDGETTTISISSWMELPKLPFYEWESMQQNDIKCNCNNYRMPKRVKIKHVAQYYNDYVEHMRLSKNFRNFSFITSLKRIKSKSCYKNMLRDNINLENMNWEVEGYDGVKNTCFKYICRYVVLATGTSDIHNTLNVPGELSNPDWVFHDLKPFESAMANLTESNQCKAHLVPVLVIGSGLSAADAVLAAVRRGIPVIHVFNSHTSLNENKFPKHMYPEYHLVYKMMKNENRPESYTALAQHIVLNICRSIKGKRVRIMAPDGLSSWYKVSLMAVMVGYRPELNFLPPEFDNGRTLGCYKSQPIDSNKNPIAVKPSTHEVVNSPKGLYAMGPLVGDNIVRVIPGGAVAIASHLIKCRKNET
ncbi:oxidative stress-induced growth inhibitor 2-like [Planococcus citri]|uniref:oxidative stress-induced growth inhibitor 2-like n=1 Tax=Planococcus citri TaxID=170843 RepID=UPI0031F9ECC2